MKPGASLIASRLTPYLVFSALGALSVYSLFFFLFNKMYMGGPDTPFYLAVADSFLKDGALRDQTSIPAVSDVTLRGVVVLHVALAKLGLGAEGRLVAISLIYFLLHVSAAYPLYKIARRVGLDGTAPVVALLAVHLGAFHVYRLELLPYNDGLFNALSVWLSYLIVVALQEFPSRRAAVVFGRPLGWTMLLGVMVGLSAVLVLFRRNAVVIIGAALLAAALTRRGRLAAWALVTLIICVGTLALFSSTPFLNTEIRLVIDGIAARLSSGALYLITDTVPRTLFAPMSERASLIFAPFGLALVMVLASGFRKREPGVMFIALSCAMAALILVALPFKDLVFGHTRYLAYVFPFLYLLVLLPQRTRVIGYMFAALVVASSLIVLVDGIHRSPEARFWLYLHEQRISLPGDEQLLVSKRPRLPYLFLRGARTTRGTVSWDQIVSHGGLVVLGDERFVAKRLEGVQRMASEAGYSFRQRVLTPGYHDAEGHKIVQVYGLTANAGGS